MTITISVPMQSSPCRAAVGSYLSPGSRRRRGPRRAPTRILEGPGGRLALDARREYHSGPFFRPRPMNRVPRVGFVSLGCPKALVDSERILTQLRAEGYDVAPTYEAADVVVVNTCGFISAGVGAG